MYTCIYNNTTTKIIIIVISISSIIVIVTGPYMYIYVYIYICIHAPELATGLSKQSVDCRSCTDSCRNSKASTQDLSNRGAVETGCSGLPYIIGSFIIYYYPHALHPPPTAPPCNEYPNPNAKMKLRWKVPVEIRIYIYIYI